MPNQSASHDNKRLVALLAGAAAASAAVLLLHRRRRLRRQAAERLEGRDGTQQHANGARHASHPGGDFNNNNTRLPPRHPHTKSGSSGSLSDTYPAVDIGAVLGVDIGGTLSKLVYFEKKAPSKADSKRRPSEDPMGKKVRTGLDSANVVVAVGTYFNFRARSFVFLTTLEIRRPGSQHARTGTFDSTCIHLHVPGVHRYNAGAFARGCT